MEQSIRPGYQWMHWFSVVINMFIYVMQVMFIILNIQTNSVPFTNKNVAVVFLILYGTIALCTIVDFLATSIRKISITGERVAIQKLLGADISVRAQVITLNADTLTIRKSYQIQLYHMENKELIKQLLAGHIQVIYNKKKAANLRTKLLIIAIILIALLIFAMTFYMFFRGWYIAFLGLLGAISVFLFVQTIRDLLEK